MCIGLYWQYWGSKGIHNNIILTLFWEVGVEGLGSN